MTGSSSSRRRILNRREVNQDEETHHRDSGEGHSSRSHSLPHGDHNHELHGLRTLLNKIPCQIHTLAGDLYSSFLSEKQTNSLSLSSSDYAYHIGNMLNQRFQPK